MQFSFIHHFYIIVNTTQTEHDFIFIFLKKEILEWSTSNYQHVEVHNEVFIFKNSIRTTFVNLQKSNIVQQPLQNNKYYQSKRQGASIKLIKIDFKMICILYSAQEAKIAREWRGNRRLSRYSTPQATELCSTRTARRGPRWEKISQEFLITVARVTFRSSFQLFLQVVLQSDWRNLEG